MEQVGRRMVGGAVEGARRPDLLRRRRGSGVEAQRIWAQEEVHVLARHSLCVRSVRSVGYCDRGLLGDLVHRSGLGQALLSLDNYRCLRSDAEADGFLV